MDGGAIKVLEYENKEAGRALRIQPGVVVRPSPDQISCDIGDEAVLLQLPRGQYYGLNTIGAQVWKRLQSGPSSVAALQNWIAEKYDVQRDECERDLDALLCSMVDAGLIELGQ